MHFLDRIFDPLPKELRGRKNKAEARLYYENQDEDFKQYKKSCYQGLIIKALVGGIGGSLVGVLLSSLLKVSGKL